MRRDGARVVLRVIVLLGISGFAVWAGCGDDAAPAAGETGVRSRSGLSSGDATRATGSDAAFELHTVTD